MPNNRDSMKNIILVSLAVCFVCSVVVSSAAVLLKPQRVANKQLDRNQNILEAAGLYSKTSAQAANADLEQLFQRFEVRFVDLEEKRLLTPLEANDLGLDPATYDQRKAAKTPGLSRALSKAEDLASISRRARYAVVYLLKDGAAIEALVLPIHGYGLWSILYGFIALESDLNTVKGITFYEHGETAGLGGEVDNPAWKAHWQGKRIFAAAAASGRPASAQVLLKVAKGSVDPTAANAIHQIDGLSGATLTSRGVENIISYWLGDEGFGPIIEKLKRG